MAHATIPPPNEHDRERADRWIKVAQNDPEMAAAVLSQIAAELRWLHNMNKPKAPGE